MSDINDKFYNEINDDEIRIIGSDMANEPSPLSSPVAPYQCKLHAAKYMEHDADDEFDDDEYSGEFSGKPKRFKWRFLIWILIAACVLVAIIYYAFGNDETRNVKELQVTVTKKDAGNTTIIAVSEPAVKQGYVTISDTTVEGSPLIVVHPENLTPSLHIGNDIVADSTVKLIMQAADIRADNGGIVSAFVDKGTLVSKGQRKSGYCAIIDGNLTIGVAESTPLLEQAIETDGYFFRQYPLVVAGQIIENKPKGKSLRKALAELNGQIVVVLSRKALTFHEFSQSLVDLGVTNAISLVGSTSYGFAVDADGTRTEFGVKTDSRQPNVNYIVWR